MPTFAVTIQKYGTEMITADSAEEAEEIARDQEADGAFDLDMHIDVDDVEDQDENR